MSYLYFLWQMNVTLEHVSGVDGAAAAVEISEVQGREPHLQEDLSILQVLMLESVFPVVI